MPELTRRELLLMATATLVGCGIDLDLPPDATFDEILDALHATSAIYDGGLANHGPMAAEALVALGEEARAAAYIDAYSTRLEWRTEVAPLPEADRASALGAVERVEEWIAAYEAEVADGASALDLLARDWPTLAPGLVGAGWHGLLRIAHAVRSLARADTPSRHRELAHGLGLHAAAHHPLPGDPGANPSLAPLDALDAVPLVPAAQRRTAGYIVDGLAPVDNLEGFADAVGAVDLDALAPPDALSQLCAAAARMYLNHGGRSIHLLHGITGTSCLRLLLDRLDEAGQRAAVGYGFQALAALRAAHGADPGAPGDVAEAGVSEADLRDAAEAADDEHAIKLIEAALREYAGAGNPELLAAAADYARV